MELTDAQNVLFLVTFADGGAEYDAVLEKISTVFAGLEQHKRTPLKEQNCWKLPEFVTAVPLRSAFDSETESLPLQGGRQNLRGAGELLSAGHTGAVAGRTCYGRSN